MFEGSGCSFPLCSPGSGEGGWQKVLRRPKAGSDGEYLLLKKRKTVPQERPHGQGLPAGVGTGSSCALTAVREVFDSAGWRNLSHDVISFPANSSSH